MRFASPTAAAPLAHLQPDTLASLAAGAMAPPSLIDRPVGFAATVTPGSTPSGTFALAADPLETPAASPPAAVVAGTPGPGSRATSRPRATSSPAPPAVSPTPTPSAGPIASNTPTQPPLVVPVPAAIDGSGATDVSAALASWIAAQPDGTTIVFPPAATYRIESPIVLTNRRDLTLLGNGSTLVATTPPAPGRSRDQVRIDGGAGIRVEGFAIVGANPTPGIYDADRQYDAGVRLRGTHDVVLAHLAVANTYGDCVYVGATGTANGGTIAWTENVRFEDSTCVGPGRQGVAITAASDVAVHRVVFEDVALWALDVEPNAGPPAGGASGIVFDSNTVVRSYFVSARGRGPVTALTVTGNAIRGAPLIVKVGSAASGYRDTAIVVEDNASDTPADGPVITLVACDDVRVARNAQPLRSGPLVVATDCTEVSET